MLSIYQRLPNFISSMKTQFRKNISYTYCHVSRGTTKPTKWPVWPAKTLIRLGIRTVWSEPSACITIVFLAIHWAHSERRLWSDWADAQADLSLRWVHRLVGFGRLWLIYMHHMCADQSVWVWVKSVKLARPWAWGSTVFMRQGPCVYGRNSCTDRNNNTWVSFSHLTLAFVEVS